MQLFGLEHHHQDNPMEWASPVEVELYYMLAHIINNQERLEKFIMALQPQVQTLIDTVTANTNAVQAAIAGLAAEATQIAALTAQVADLQAQLAGGTPIDAEDLAAIGTAVTTLQATNAALTTAVPANVQPTS
jgi:phage I-like protein